MDPLFWILAGVVSICVIGIVILWLMERRATRQLAAQQNEESATLRAVDPLDALEQIDTRPIPAAAQPSTQQSTHQESPAPVSSAYQYTLPDNRSAGILHREVPIQPAAPLPPPQHPQPPADQFPRQETAQPVKATPPPVTTQQEQLQTTPERAMLRAAELARERRSLEQLLEDNQARLDTLLHGSALPDAKDATTVSLLQSEMAGQRERLQEITFLEQSYRQVASPVTEQLAQQKRQASSNTPGAFGVRRHPLAPVQPPEQE
jgi:hypothetical protein